MKSLSRSMGLVIWLASVAYGATGGMIAGTVTDPSGAPLKGAFVRARNPKSKITASVLSDKQGRYQIRDLAAGDYDVQATAIGYKSDPPKGVKVDVQPVAMDLALQKGMVRWTDLSNHQARELLPAGKAKPLLVGRCFACHGSQTRMAARRQDEASWRRDVDYMRDSFRYFLRDQINDEAAAELASYLTTTFGVDSELPRSPAELPGYEKVKRGEFSDEAMKIVYVDYELPGPNRMPWSAAPDKDGNFWIPYYGRANQVGKLDPKTGAVQEFRAPYPDTAAIHSAVAAPDGTVWFTEQGSNRLGHLDPRTREVVEYQAPLKDGIGTARGSKHTLRVDPSGNVWATGSPLSRFDPKTEKFTEFPEVPSAYGLVLDKEGNLWFAEFTEDGKIGKVDAKTGKVTKWAPPTPKARPRRIQLDSDGTLVFAEFAAGKIGRFDPKTETFQEFSLPGPAPTPYALGIDRNRFIWYSSEAMDIVGRLDPKTGEVIEYPFPYSENSMREFFLDAEGRMWFASPPNNKVGNFILTPGS